MSKRFEAYGWHVLHVENGNSDLDSIAKAIEEAKSVTDKPSMIKVTTTIGYGSPNKANTAGVHGAALGGDEVKATRENLGWGHTEFEVPEDALKQFRKAIDRGAQSEEEWNKVWADYKAKYAEEAAEFERMLADKLPDGWDKALPTYTPADKALATRKNSENDPQRPRSSSSRTDRRIGRLDAFQPHRVKSLWQFPKKGNTKTATCASAFGNTAWVRSVTASPCIVRDSFPTVQRSSCSPIICATPSACQPSPKRESFG